MSEETYGSILLKFLKSFARYLSMPGKCLIGPLFLEDEAGETVTVNQERYRYMINDFLSQLFVIMVWRTSGFNRMALHHTQLEPLYIFETIVP